MKHKRQSLQSIRAKIQIYRRQFGTIHSTPLDKLPKKCCAKRMYIAWSKTLDLYSAQFGELDVVSSKETMQWLSILDSLLTKVVRVLMPQCAMCGKKPTRLRDSQASHILSKSMHPQMRYELENVTHMCDTCHKKFHRDPIWAYLWLEERFPNRTDTLMQLKEKPLYTTKDYECIQRFFLKTLENYLDK